jgi:hypothetical protein
MGPLNAAKSAVLVGAAPGQHSGRGVEFMVDPPGHTVIHPPKSKQQNFSLHPHHPNAPWRTSLSTWRVLAFSFPVTSFRCD